MTTTTNTDAPAYIEDGVLTDGEGWVAIQSHVLSADATGVTFQSSTGANDWSQYMDLTIIAYGQSDTETSIIGRFNNDTGTNYIYQEFTGNGSASSAYVPSPTNYNFWGYCPKVSDGANDFAAFKVDLFDINSGKYKNSTSQTASDKGGSGFISLLTSVWRSQAPITEIDVLAWTGDWKDGSRFDLFGLLPRMGA
tara:strand:- start:1326 stop:1910 length:585 start_codon:yes stop_codon:yes gene_type:complete